MIKDRAHYGLISRGRAPKAAPSPPEPRGSLMTPATACHILIQASCSDTEISVQGHLHSWPALGCSQVRWETRRPIALRYVAPEPP